MTKPDTAPPKHILLADDDRLIIATLSRGLSQAGYRVSTAESSEEAEALLASGERPDLAILDIRMPGQNGLYLARRLQELDRIPFVMLSAFSEQQMVDEATRHGALGYLVKPLDIPQLVPAIETALGRANELQELHTIRQQLQDALDAERQISVAVGITMMQYHLGRREAFELLRKSARSRRCKLAALADEIIQAGVSLKS
jgi:two-component system, response regulator PdtaR